MPGLSKVIVLDPDVRAGRQVQLGFEREGLSVATVPVGPAKLDLLGDDAGLVVIGGGDRGALELVGRARAALDELRLDIPIVFTGRGVMRDEAEAAGADEVVQPPAYLRDVVTLGRVLCGVPATHRGHLVGNLIEVTGVFTLVRAFAALGRSATLTLIRGLRRGEIRFYHGEVTSAQVGMIHGQAALHQLLLWTDARFDFHHEDVVRRQQIPLTHDELFADAERFLEGVRDSSGGLSPSIVLEQDLPRVQSFGRQIPTEVYGVLRMFDGHRVLADVLEDSAYRVFETLRVAQRAVEIGLLRAIDKQPVRASWRAILALEEWLVGSESREAVVDSGPVAAPGAGPRGKSRKRRKKRKRTATPVAVAPAAKDIDWGALVPRTVGAEVGPLAGVVPAAQASGEIAGKVAPSPQDRAPHAREPKVVFDEAAERARNAADVAARAEAIRAEQARVDAEAQAQRDADAQTQRDAEAQTQRDAEEADAQAARAAAARDEADAQAARDAAARDEADAQAARDAAAREQAAREQAEREQAAAKTQRDAEQAEAARLEADAKTQRVAQETAAAAEAARAAQAEADARANAIRVVADTVTTSSESTPVADPSQSDDTKPERVNNRTTLQGVAVAAGSVVGDAPVVDLSGAITARTTVPYAAVIEASVAPITSGAITTKIAVVPPPESIAPPLVAAPGVIGVIVDEPSDGVIVQHITTAKTAPVKRRRLPTDPPEDDRPEDTMGEITSPGARPTADPRHSEPSILVADLVTDLAAVHTAVSAIADEQAAAPPTADATSGSREAPVVAARRDVAAFSEVEEAFFRAGHEKDAVVTAPPIAESFEDLDEGYHPVGFWNRLRGKGRRPVTLDKSPAAARAPARDAPPARDASPGPAKSPALARSPVSARSPAPGKPKKPHKKK